MKHIYAFLFITASLAVSAQSDAIQGACSITLTSPEETRQQTYCYAAFEPIVPITYAVNGSGITVTGLPPGITTSFSGGILTISGTPTTYGFWAYQIQTSEGCSTTFAGLGFSQIFEPELSCSDITDHGLTFNWPDLNTMQDGTLFVTWGYGSTADTEVYFLPTDVTSLTLDNVPPDTMVSFGFWVESGTPLCMPNAVTYSCTTTALGVDDFEHRVFKFFPNPATDYLEFSGDVPIDDIRFYDLPGREIKRVVSPSQQIDVSALPPAVYLMKVTGGDNVESFKLIKR